MQPKPAITFRVNCKTQNRTGHVVPNRTEASGNETVAEADNQKNQRWVYLPGSTPGTNHYGGFGSQLKHDSEFTEYGLKAIYLKNTYCSTTDPDAVLTVVSTDWDDHA